MNDLKATTILCVTRAVGESVVITIPGATPDKNIQVRVQLNRVQGNSAHGNGRARLAIIAPPEVKIARAELESKC